MKKITTIVMIISFMFAVIVYARCLDWDPGDTGSTPRDYDNPKIPHAKTGAEPCPCCVADFIRYVEGGCQ